MTRNVQGITPDVHAAAFKGNAPDTASGVRTLTCNGQEAQGNRIGSLWAKRAFDQLLSGFGRH